HSVKATSFMLIAGEASGDLLAAELVGALKKAPPVQAIPFPPRFFGAGGQQMARQGVELALDLTRHSVIGVSDVLRKYWEFKGIFDRLFALAIDRRPDVIVCVDFSGFNRRFARAIKEHVRTLRGSFNNWEPRIVQYVSPQVWASRPGRAFQLARDVDLLLSIFPFEKEWYASRVPKLKVVFVGHPMVDRHRIAERGTRNAGQVADIALTSATVPNILLLPGSRTGELKRHLPVMVDAAKHINRARPARFRMVLPNDALGTLAEPCKAQLHDLQLQIGGLAEALAEADLAITKSGTITMECAFFGVPAVVCYKTSWPTYLVGRIAVNVRHLAMPNLLAGEEIYPEFIQHHATGENIARASLQLVNDTARRNAMKARLSGVMQSLGKPGASERAAESVLKLLDEQPCPIRGALGH
ncbi:MAG TPA: lipid-A-disaccharide synthase, partial [Verrucomicrobiae bacterium]|nr:lipid-A-disaccharide synthase [Verrucomicrobiae bacterium]